jgi:hypothetical protein
MATDVLPTVRQFLACQSISVADSDDAILLRRPLHTIQLPESAQFPYRLREIWFYVQLANVVQLNQLSVRMIESEQGVMIGTSQLQPVPAMSSEADIVEAFFVLRRVPLQHAGVYEYVLFSNGRELANARRLLVAC